CLAGCMQDGTCVCSYGWTGSACNVECKGGASNPCSNHGICRTDGMCICDRGWTGADCSIECAGAAENPNHWPCHLHGNCEGWFINPQTQFQYGLACEIECPGGAHSICSRHGVCDDVGECSCFKGFRNKSCEVACLGQRDCNPATGCEGVCNYAGSCQEDGSCICEAAFRGSACELVCPPFTGLASDICNLRGVCNAEGVCNCYVWYQGVACEQIASWVIAVVVLFTLALIAVSVHLIRRWLHNRMRARRRARRERRKVRRTEAAVNRMKGYKVPIPDDMSMQAKGI
ncbi:hypothetical protein GUITHDRAFT_64838, partial [Guillardia theta CCMP2712]